MMVGFFSLTITTSLRLRHESVTFPVSTAGWRAAGIHRSRQ
jgi:hypothetical protein